MLHLISNKVKLFSGYDLFDTMKNKFLVYIYPLIAVAALGLMMLRPNSFHLLPATIYQAFEVKSMEEYEFIVWFDVVFLFIMYVFFFIVLKKILNWKRKHLNR